MWRSLVSRLVRVQEASGSNPDTPTKKKESIFMVSFFFIALMVTRGLLVAIPERFPQSGERMGAYALGSACAASGSNPDTPTKKKESTERDSFFIWC